MERACLSSSDEGLHRQITLKATDFRARFSGSSCIYSLSALQWRTSSSFCHRAKLRLDLFSLPGKKLISGVHLLTHRGASNRFRVFSSLKEDNLVEGSCGSSGQLGGGDASTSEPETDMRLAINDQLVLDRNMEPLALQEISYEIDENEISGVEDDLAVASGLSSHSNATWFQAYFIKVVGPIVRLLNGNHLSKSSSIRSEKYEWQGEETPWSLIKLLNGSLPPDYHRRKIGKRLQKIEADFFLLTSHIGRFLLVMMSTGAILATGFQLAGGNSELEALIWYSWLAGIICGSMIGAEKVMEKRVRSGPRNVVITGRLADFKISWVFGCRHLDLEGRVIHKCGPAH